MFGKKKSSVFLASVFMANIGFGCAGDAARGSDVFFENPKEKKILEDSIDDLIEEMMNDGGANDTDKSIFLDEFPKTDAYDSKPSNKMPLAAEEISNLNKIIDAQTNDLNNVEGQNEIKGRGENTIASGDVVLNQEHPTLENNNSSRSGDSGIGIDESNIDLKVPSTVTPVAEDFNDVEPNEEIDGVQREQENSDVVSGSGSEDEVQKSTKEINGPAFEVENFDNNVEPNEEIDGVQRKQENTDVVSGSVSEDEVQKPTEKNSSSSTQTTTDVVDTNLNNQNVEEFVEKPDKKYFYLKLKDVYQRIKEKIASSKGLEKFEAKFSSLMKRLGINSPENVKIAVGLGMGAAGPAALVSAFKLLKLGSKDLDVKFVDNNGKVIPVMEDPLPIPVEDETGKKNESPGKEKGEGREDTENENKDAEEQEKGKKEDETKGDEKDNSKKAEISDEKKDDTKKGENTENIENKKETDEDKNDKSEVNNKTENPGGKKDGVKDAKYTTNGEDKKTSEPGKENENMAQSSDGKEIPGEVYEIPPSVVFGTGVLALWGIYGLINYLVHRNSRITKYRPLFGISKEYTRNLNLSKLKELPLSTKLFLALFGANFNTATEEEYKNYLDNKNIYNLLIDKGSIFAVISFTGEELIGAFNKIQFVDGSGVENIDKKLEYSLSSEVKNIDKKSEYSLSPNVVGSKTFDLYATCIDKNKTDSEKILLYSSSVEGVDKKEVLDAISQLVEIAYGKKAAAKEKIKTILLDNDENISLIESAKFKPEELKDIFVGQWPVDQLKDSDTLQLTWLKNPIGDKVLFLLKSGKNFLPVDLSCSPAGLVSLEKLVKQAKENIKDEITGLLNDNKGLLEGAKFKHEELNDIFKGNLNFEGDAKFSFSFDDLEEDKVVRFFATKEGQDIDGKKVEIYVCKATSKDLKKVKDLVKKAKAKAATKIQKVFKGMQARRLKIKLAFKDCFVEDQALVEAANFTNVDLTDVFDRHFSFEKSARVVIDTEDVKGSEAAKIKVAKEESPDTWETICTFKATPEDLEKFKKEFKKLVEKAKENVKNEITGLLKDNKESIEKFRFKGNEIREIFDVDLETLDNVKLIVSFENPQADGAVKITFQVNNKEVMDFEINLKYTSDTLKKVKTLVEKAKENVKNEITGLLNDNKGLLEGAKFKYEELNDIFKGDSDLEGYAKFSFSFDDLEKDEVVRFFATGEGQDLDDDDDEIYTCKATLEDLKKVKDLVQKAKENMKNEITGLLKDNKESIEKFRFKGNEIREIFDVNLETLDNVKLIVSFENPQADGAVKITFQVNNKEVMDFEINLKYTSDTLKKVKTLVEKAKEKERNIPGDFVDDLFSTVVTTLSKEEAEKAEAKYKIETFLNKEEDKVKNVDLISEIPITYADLNENGITEGANEKISIFEGAVKFTVSAEKDSVKFTGIKSPLNFSLSYSQVNAKRFLRLLELRVNRKEIEERKLKENLPKRISDIYEKNKRYFEKLSKQAIPKNLYVEIFGEDFAARGFMEGMVLCVDGPKFVVTYKGEQISNINVINDSYNAAGVLQEYEKMADAVREYILKQETDETRTEIPKLLNDNKELLGSVVFKPEEIHSIFGKDALVDSNVKVSFSFDDLPKDGVVRFFATKEGQDIDGKKVEIYVCKAASEDLKKVKDLVQKAQAQAKAKAATKIQKVFRGMQQARRLKIKRAFKDCFVENKASVEGANFTDVDLNEVFGGKYFSFEKSTRVAIDTEDVKGSEAAKIKTAKKESPNTWETICIFKATPEDLEKFKKLMEKAKEKAIKEAIQKSLSDAEEVISSLETINSCELKNILGINIDIKGKYKLTCSFGSLTDKEGAKISVIDDVNNKTVYTYICNATKDDLNKVEKLVTYLKVRKEMLEIVSNKKVYAGTFDCAGMKYIFGGEFAFEGERIFNYDFQENGDGELELHIETNHKSGKQIQVAQFKVTEDGLKELKECNEKAKKLSEKFELLRKFGKSFTAIYEQHFKNKLKNCEFSNSFNCFGVTYTQTYLIKSSTHYELWSKIGVTEKGNLHWEVITKGLKGDVGRREWDIDLNEYAFNEAAQLFLDKFSEIYKCVTEKEVFLKLQEDMKIDCQFKKEEDGVWGFLSW